MALGDWGAPIVNTPGLAAQATATRAAQAGGRNVCTGLIASLATGASAQTPILLNLRDGASGAGTILLTVALSSLAGGSSVFSLLGLNIVGSPNTAMTWEFAAAGVAASQESVTIIGYTSQT